MKRVAIIGGGLAGTACAYVLKQRGAEPVIYEAGKEIASGASGNALGLYNPRFSVEDPFYAEAFLTALETFADLDNIEWHPCGSVHLITDDKKEKRFQDYIKTWGWSDMRLLDAAEASDIAGVEVRHKALWHGRAGVVSPKKLCERYVQGIEIHLNASIKKLSDVKADAIIIANGMGAKKFEETKGLPLKAVRGQITFVKPNEQSKKMKCNICYGGYMTPVVEGVHAVGSTFQRWLDHDQIIAADDAENIEKLTKAVPSLKNFEIAGQRAAVRTTTDEHFPIFGPLQGHSNLYVSTAHGSHGVITSIAAARLITDDILKRP